MLSDFNIVKIINDNHNTLITSINGKIKRKDFFLKIIFFDFLPFIIATIAVLISGNLNESIINVIITGLSILSGLFFSLIILITEKAKEIRQQYDDAKDTELINFKIRYLNYSKQTISQISYCILIALIIIILAFTLNLNLNLTTFEFLNKHIDVLNNFFLVTVKFVNLIIFILLQKYVIVFILILNSMYTILMEQISNKKIK